MANRRGDKGISLVEVAIAAAVLSIIVLVSAKMLTSFYSASLRARQEIRGNRLVKDIKGKLDAMPFEFVFPMDSSLPQWGLPASHANFITSTTMNSILQDARNMGFSRVVTEVVFMRRDTSNILGQGTSALIPFTDNNGDLIDDYDPNIRFTDRLRPHPTGLRVFRDLNGDGFDDSIGDSCCISDGDFFDVFEFYGVNGEERMVTEMPETNLRQVTVSLYTNDRPGTPLVRQDFLISKEKISGNSGSSGESDLKIDVTVPAQPRVFYRYLTGPQQNAQNRAASLIRPYTTQAYRADSSVPFQLGGVTSPQSFVLVSTVTTLNETTPSSLRDVGNSDVAGNFLFNSPKATSGLVEGLNVIKHFSLKQVVVLGQNILTRSPLGQIRVILDTRPPKFPPLERQPNNNNVKTLSPVVRAVLIDDTSSTTTVSGIDPSVITMKIKPQGNPWMTIDSLDMTYDPATGRVRWWNRANRLPPTLVDNKRYDVEIEGGDLAHYAVDTDWDFRINIDPTDFSPPVVSGRFPANLTTAASNPTPIRCTILDPHSGVDYSSVVLTVQGIDMISSVVTPLMGDFIDAETGVVTLPSYSCVSGATVNVQVTATHWGVVGVAANDTVINAWSFQCP